MSSGASEQPGTARMTYIGGPTVLIEIGPPSNPLRLLTDPTFEPAGFSYPAGPQEIAKTTAPAIAADALGRVDAVLLSHDQHNDNLDPAGRALLAGVGQTLTTPAGAARLGGNARGLAPWESMSLSTPDGFAARVTAMPARHGPEEVKRLAGDVTGWMIEWAGQRRGAFYISGDTVYYDELEEIARRYQVALALLNCGAARAQRLGPAAITLTGAEAAQLAGLLDQAVIVPVHYEGWSHFSEGRAEIEEAFAATGLTSRLRFLTPGQPVAFEV